MKDKNPCELIPPIVSGRWIARLRFIQHLGENPDEWADLENVTEIFFEIQVRQNDRFVEIRSDFFPDRPPFIGVFRRLTDACGTFIGWELVVSDTNRDNDASFFRVTKIKDNIVLEAEGARIRAGFSAVSQIAYDENHNNPLQTPTVGYWLLRKIIDENS